MYKIDPKYFGKRNLYKENPEENQTKYDSLVEYDLLGMKLWLGFSFQYSDQLKKYIRDEEHTKVSILAPDGGELVEMSRKEFAAYDVVMREKTRALQSAETNLRKQTNPASYERQREILRKEKKVAFRLASEPFVESAARDIEIIEHMPSEMFLQNATLGEEILTEYQAVKMDELKQLPAGENCQAFVDSVKEDVAYINKTLNNIENTREAKENMEDLFKRDRNI